jgi:hypothetical protein
MQLRIRYQHRCYLIAEQRLTVLFHKRVALSAKLLKTRQRRRWLHKRSDIGITPRKRWRDRKSARISECSIIQGDSV